MSLVGFRCITSAFGIAFQGNGKPRSHRLKCRCRRDYEYRDFLTAFEFVTTIVSSNGLHESIEPLHHGCHIVPPALRVGLEAEISTVIPEADRTNSTKVRDFCGIRHSLNRLAQQVGVARFLKVINGDLGPGNLEQLSKQFKMLQPGG